MFDYIVRRMTRPGWANQRWFDLFVRDQMLDGEFYAHLPHAFHDEESGGRQTIPFRDRRPSVIYNLAHEIASDLARKLFARRHFPHFIHPDAEIAAAAAALTQEGALRLRLLQAALWGSSGSTAITFRILAVKDGVRLAFAVHRSRNCQPSFDGVGELGRLRERYVTDGAALLAIGLERAADGEKIEAADRYWFVRDYDREEEITYLPIKEEGYEETRLVAISDDPDDRWRFRHDFGFVPAQWMRNLAGGREPDGACTWWAAKEIAVEIDYTLSMTGRGLRYNAAPQAITVGDIKNIVYSDGGSASYVRGPSNVWEGEPEQRSSGGEMRGGFDAKLLEMKGDGLNVAMAYVERLDKYARRVIAASRKDPDRLVVPQSGKAMELLETEDLDLLDELRTNYGDEGLLPLIRKAIRAAAKMGHPLVKGIDLDALGSLALQWPKPVQPGAEELRALALALDLATGNAHAPKGSEPKPIITIEEARHLMLSWVDIPPLVPSISEQQEASGIAVGAPLSPPPTENPVPAEGPEGGRILEPHPVGSTIGAVTVDA